MNEMKAIKILNEKFDLENSIYYKIIIKLEVRK